jgi:hypothetical protein
MYYIMPVKASDNVPEKTGLGEMGAMWRSQVYWPRQGTTRSNSLSMMYFHNRVVNDDNHHRSLREQLECGARPM